MIASGVPGKARDIVIDLAEKLSGGDVSFAGTQDAQSLSRGNSGLSIFYDYAYKAVGLARYRKLSQLCLLRALKIAMMGQVELSPGLFTGLAGLGFAATHVALSDDLTTFLEQTDQVLASTSDAGAIALSGDPIEGPMFDLVSGVIGLGVYWHARSPKSDQARRQLQAIARYLTLVLNADGSPISYATPQRGYDPQLSSRCPHGLINCGMAHGVPGAIAFASLISRNNRPLRDLVHKNATWWIGTRQKYGFWPDVISLAEDGTYAEFDTIAAPRPVWCYGSAGICRALMMAGRATDDAGIYNQAVTYLADDSQLVLTSLDQVGNTLCHGLAGLSQIITRTYRETGDRRLLPMLHTIFEALVDRYDFNLPLGYRDWSKELGFTDPPGLLTGAAGIGLALLSFCSTSEPDWDRVLLVS
ncbi:lanthionine synthetase C family protein [Rhizobium sp. AU243]|uniref:lanthionine synthetase C family protein n=1 Tax=Rhizobium sp. AU243 TaxID=2303425 RepID=UPI0010CBEAD1|nr:lanthionine synthetase C family protein [Rhizobium sp. AU243]TKV76129.1 hypothetical protein D0C28_10720 [Rhizobium sp. AU243]